MTDTLEGLAALALDEDALAAFGALDPAEQATYLELLDQVLEGHWLLTPKQQLAETLWGKVDWLLYGGSAAGGKSEFACNHANRLSEEIPGHNTLLIRQSIPELRRSLILRLIARGRQFKLPMRLRKVDGQTGFHYENGSLIECGYLATDEHVGNYLSAEYDCVASDTLIVMADGGLQRIDAIMPGQMVATLEGPRRVTVCAPVGSKEAVRISTPAGEVVASLTHPFLTEHGWVSPLESLETSASQAGGRSGSAVFDDSLRGASPPQEWSVRATLLSPRPRLGRVGCANDRPDVPAYDLAGSSTQDSRASCMTDHGSCGERSRRASRADRARIPARVDAGASDGDREQLDGQVRTRTRTLATGTFRHPYTMEDRLSFEAVRQASVEISRVGVREMWDMTVQGANHYVSSSLMIHRNCIVIDEATQLMPDHIVALSARMRTTKQKAKLGARPHLGLFTNPGDVSHAFLYNLFVVPTDYGNKVVVFNVANGIERAFPVRSYDAPVPIREASFDDIEDVLIPWARDLVVECDPESELAVAFVPSKATDNPHIDRSYLKFLNALPEKRRRQLRDGDWDTFDGQFFDEWNRDLHVVKPFDIPEHWARARAADWGSAAPWACVWGAWDPESGDCYIYRERYGAGLTPQQQAKQAKEGTTTERADGTKFTERYFATVADPSVFSDRRGQGKSIADLWRESGFTVSRAKNARIAGWQNVRQYLWDDTKDNGPDRVAGGPRLFIFDTCPDTARTFPLMQRDKDNPEDLNTKLEDHALDAVRYLLALRPMQERMKPPKHGKSIDQRFQHLMQQFDKKKNRRKW